jgi:hypothetical protein
MKWWCGGRSCGSRAASCKRGPPRREPPPRPAALPTPQGSPGSAPAVATAASDTAMPPNDACSRGLRPRRSISADATPVKARLMAPTRMDPRIGDLRPARRKTFGVCGGRGVLGAGGRMRGGGMGV